MDPELTILKRRVQQARNSDDLLHWVSALRVYLMQKKTYEPVKRMTFDEMKEIHIC